jgi:hypothetical protein
MHWSLSCSCSGLVSSTCAGSGSSSGSYFAGSIANVQLCDTNIKCNAWGLKCNMMHVHDQPKHINPYKLFYEFTHNLSIY